MKELSLAMLALLAATSAAARDDIEEFSIKDALNTPAAHAKLDKTVKLYFGKQGHPPVARRLGEWKTNKKTNAFNKSSREACEWTFLSAALELQERAHKEGGNAVINIVSNYKSHEFSSTSVYTCGVGALMVGVAFKGTVVRLGR